VQLLQCFKIHTSKAFTIESATGFCSIILCKKMSRKTRGKIKICAENGEEHKDDFRLA
jgi:hypothetical protein